MQDTILIVGALLLGTAGCGQQPVAKAQALETTAPNHSTVESFGAPAANKKLYMDVHHLGAGNVTAEAIPDAIEEVSEGR